MARNDTSETAIAGQERHSLRTRSKVWSASRPRSRAFRPEYVARHVSKTAGENGGESAGINSGLSRSDVVCIRICARNGSTGKLKSDDEVTAAHASPLRHRRDECASISKLRAYHTRLLDYA